MADNISVLDSTGTARVVRATDASSVYTPHHIVDDLVGVTATGQATKANSLPVTLASDEDALSVTPATATSGGCSIFRSLDLDETEEEVKATAGQVYGYYVSNSGAAAAYLKFYNATAASVTVGTTTPVLTLLVPAGAAANVGLPYPVAFSTAITVAATTGVADSDTTGPAANEVIVNIFYA